MSLTLYIHPLASFCHKVLIALYENGTPFTAQLVNFAQAESSAAVLDQWPVGKIPVLFDATTQRMIPEASIIIEYLEQHYPGPVPMLPTTAEAQLQARLWDRVFDLYVSIPMQKIVLDRLRPGGGTDPVGVAEARAGLQTVYGMIDQHMAARRWAIGDAFCLADCAAVPALFFAGIVEPFAAEHRHLAGYFERLLARASVQRVLAEARPYFPMFPYVDAMPARFLAG